MMITISSNDFEDDDVTFGLLHGTLTLALETLRKTIPDVEWDGEVEA